MHWVRMGHTERSKGWVQLGAWWWGEMTLKQSPRQAVCRDLRFVKNPQADTNVSDLKGDNDNKTLVNPI